MAHLGLGSFFRAHQAWYTDRAPDAAQWGIAAFTGRGITMADALRPQGGLYTLVTRASDADRFGVVGALSAVHTVGEHDAWLHHLTLPDLAVVTVTVTEAGYLASPDGRLDTTSEALARDVTLLRDDPTAPVITAPARLLSGLVARAKAGLAPLAVLPCDNLPGNGPRLASVVEELAHLVDPGLVAVVAQTASFVTTVVDRITPETTADDVDEVAARSGVLDRAPVVTEPFSEWVISGEFPAGRPEWEAAGARVTDDIGPFEKRKLWLLNGAHSLLAYAASTRGHLTVADAVAEPLCRSWVEEWWDECCRHLPLPETELASYRKDLLTRFDNARIRHQLGQIAADGSQKMPIRILPVLRAEVRAGRVPDGALRALAGWVCHLRGLGAPVNDAHAQQALDAARGTVADAAAAVLRLLDPELAAHTAVIDSLVVHIEALSG